MRFGLVLLGPVMLLLAGCSATTQHTLRPPVTSVPTQQPTTTAVAVSVPSHLAGEISRDVYTGTAYRGRIGDVPESAKQLSLHLVCAGPAGSQMRYEIQDGKGSRYSSGVASCDGQEHLNTETNAAKRFPLAALIHLDADPGVVNGWAALTDP